MNKIVKIILDIKRRCIFARFNRVLTKNSSIIRIVFLILLISSLGFMPVFIFACKSEVREKWSASSLNIPARNSPWQLMTEIEGKYIILGIPGDMGMIETFPENIQRIIGKKIGLRNSNIELLSYYATEAEDLLKKEKFTQVPQYDRFLNEAVISINPLVDIIDGNPLFRHEPLLLNLPRYTVISIFASSDDVNAVEKRLKILGLPNKIEVIPVPVWDKVEDGIEFSHRTPTWAQDIMRVSRTQDGTEYIFSPASYIQEHNLNIPDLDFLRHLVHDPGKRKIVRLPVFFRAGNILIGEAREKIMFFGEGVNKFHSVSFFHAVYSKPRDESIIPLLKATSGVNRHYVLPNSTKLIHLDMAMAFLSRGVAAVIDPLDRDDLSSADEKVLSEISKTLLSLGFEVIPIPTTTKRIESFQSPVNIVPFVNKDDRKRYILLPEYKDSLVHVNGKPQSINGMIRDAYRKHGINVIPVEDRFHFNTGDIHCALKVIN